MCGWVEGGGGLQPLFVLMRQQTWKWCTSKMFKHVTTITSTMGTMQITHTDNTQTIYNDVTALCQNLEVLQAQLSTHNHNRSTNTQLAFAPPPFALSICQTQPTASYIMPRPPQQIAYAAVPYILLLLYVTPLDGVWCPQEATVLPHCGIYPV